MVGLGNPGRKYQNTRHNIGFQAIDQIVEQYDFQPLKDKFDSFIYQGSISDQEVIAAKPQNYMNNSGKAVGQLLKHYRLTLADLIVLHDDIELTPGKIRVKTGGGAGGHNGLRSIDATIGKEYHRIRIGVGHPGNKDAVSDYVLSDFLFAERDLFTNLTAKIAHHLPLYLEGEHEKFCNLAQ